MCLQHLLLLLGKPSTRQLARALLPFLGVRSTSFPPPSPGLTANRRVTAEAEFGAERRLPCGPRPTSRWRSICKACKVPGQKLEQMLVPLPKKTSAESPRAQLSPRESSCPHPRKSEERRARALRWSNSKIQTPRAAFGRASGVGEYRAAHFWERCPLLKALSLPCIEWLSHTPGKSFLEGDGLNRRRERGKEARGAGAFTPRGLQREERGFHRARWRCLAFLGPRAPVSRGPRRSSLSSRPTQALCFRAEVRRRAERPLVTFSWGRRGRLKGLGGRGCGGGEVHFGPGRGSDRDPLLTAGACSEEEKAAVAVAS